MEAPGLRTLVLVDQLGYDVLATMVLEMVSFMCPLAQSYRSSIQGQITLGFASWRFVKTAVGHHIITGRRPTRYGKAPTFRVGLSSERPRAFSNKRP